MTTALGFFVWLFGLCVGSFLNVVVYRLPAGLSVSEPRWSFCPRCRATLQPLDNIPVLSWLWLSAKCRYCRAPISAQYPLVEAATGLAFVVAYHLLFVDATRFGLEAPAIGVDWPLLIAWLVLVATLVVCTAMDLVSYSIFPVVTNVACVVGVLLMALWPRETIMQPIGGGSTYAGATAAFVVCMFMLWREGRREHATAAMAQTAEELSEADSDPSDSQSNEEAAPQESGGVAGLVGIASSMLLACAIATLPALGESTLVEWAFPLLVAAFVCLFITIFIVGATPREADDEIHAAVEEEATQARSVSLGELLWLMPSILAGVFAWWITSGSSALGEAWNALLFWQPVGGMMPILGANYAIFGICVAAALGWMVRIGFTLIFGREAFGTGDIFILAAAGACGGWDIALLGFLLSIPIALTAWIMSLFVKRSIMIPFGPPLALGFLAALGLSYPGARIAQRYVEGIEIAWHEQPQLIYMSIGLLLVGGAFAVLVAKGTRHLLERGSINSEN